MDIFDTYATDENLERDGAWVELSPTAKLKVARSNTAEYAKLLNKLADERRPELDLGGDVAEQVSTEILVEVMAQTILRDWQGLTFKKVPMPYSVENAKKLLGVRDFRVRVAQISDERAHYRIKEEAEQGNG